MASLEFHPKLYRMWIDMSRRYGPARVGSLHQFAKIYGDKIAPDAAREQYMTISVHLNPRSSAGTKVSFNHNETDWYENLCETLGVDALEWRGTPVYDIQPTTRLTSLQPIRPRPAYQPVKEDTVDDTNSRLPYKAPNSCRPGTFKRRHARYEKMAECIGKGIVEMAHKSRHWDDIKTKLRSQKWSHNLVRTAAKDPSLHDHITKRTVDAVMRAVSKEKDHIRHLKKLQERVERDMAQQHLSASQLNQNGKIDGMNNPSIGTDACGTDTATTTNIPLEDNLSDDDDDDEVNGFLNSSRVGRAVQMNDLEGLRIQLDQLPSQIGDAIRNHLLRNEENLRQSFSYMPLPTHAPASSTSYPVVSSSSSSPSFVSKPSSSSGGSSTSELVTASAGRRKKGLAGQKKNKSKTAKMDHSEDPSMPSMIPFSFSNSKRTMDNMPPLEPIRGKITKMKKNNTAERKEEEEEAFIEAPPALRPVFVSSRDGKQSKKGTMTETPKTDHSAVPSVISMENAYRLQNPPSTPARDKDASKPSKQLSFAPNFDEDVVATSTPEYEPNTVPIQLDIQDDDDDEYHEWGNRAQYEDLYEAKKVIEGNVQNHFTVNDFEWFDVDESDNPHNTEIPSTGSEIAEPIQFDVQNDNDVEFFETEERVTQEHEDSYDEHDDEYDTAATTSIGTLLEDSDTDGEKPSDYFEEEIEDEERIGMEEVGKQGEGKETKFLENVEHAANNESVTTDRGTFFETHYYSKELFEHACKNYKNHVDVMYPHASPEDPCHIGLQHYGRFNKRDKANLIRSAQFDDGDDILKEVKGMYLGYNDTVLADGFQHEDSAYSKYRFHDATEMGI